MSDYMKLGTDIILFPLLEEIYRHGKLSFKNKKTANNLNIDIYLEGVFGMHLSI